MSTDFEGILWSGCEPRAALVARARRAPAFGRFIREVAREVNGFAPPVPRRGPQSAEIGILSPDAVAHVDIGARQIASQQAYSWRLDWPEGRLCF